SPGTLAAMSTRSLLTNRTGMGRLRESRAHRAARRSGDGRRRRAAWPPRARGPRRCARNARRDKDLALAMLEYVAAKRRCPPMEAEQLNLIAHTLADLKSRTAEMRRFL